MPATMSAGMPERSAAALMISLFAAIHSRRSWASDGVDQYASSASGSCVSRSRMSSNAADSSSLPTGWVNSAFGPLPAGFASGSSLACAASARSAGIDPSSSFASPKPPPRKSGSALVRGVERSRTAVPGLLLDALRPAARGARAFVHNSPSGRPW
ncbi:hypothetical protein [Streptomyces sp. MS1.AVA.4]|uniref:Uncharacterized protein n=1 Tax=Streptomyces pratisoli TaxID=3139917 RepID=A0ACC6QPF7_9ACTN